MSTENTGGIGDSEEEFGFSWSDVDPEEEDVSEEEDILDDIRTTHDQEVITFNPEFLPVDAILLNVIALGKKDIKEEVCDPKITEIEIFGYRSPTQKLLRKFYDPEDSLVLKPGSVSLSIVGKDTKIHEIMCMQDIGVLSKQVIINDAFAGYNVDIAYNRQGNAIAMTLADEIKFGGLLSVNSENGTGQMVGVTVIAHENEYSGPATVSQREYLKQILDSIADSPQMQVD